MLSVQLIGLKGVNKMLKPYTDKQNYEDARQECLEDAEKWAKIFAAVSDPSKYETSGELEESIHIEGDALVADAPWAVFNEFGCYNIEVGTVQNPKGAVSGSGKFAYRPFMRPAMLLAIQDFPTRLFSKMSVTRQGIVSIRVGQKSG